MHAKQVDKSRRRGQPPRLMSPEEIKCPCCHNHKEESSFTHFQVNLASDADRKVGFPFRALELLARPDCGVVFERHDSPK
jgi:hypothetical protein